jgi:hypothetical protein
MLGRHTGCGHQGIEATIAGTPKQNASSCLVLDHKKERMELNENMIIKSESMNG